MEEWVNTAPCGLGCGGAVCCNAGQCPKGGETGIGSNVVERELPRKPGGT